MSVSFAPGLKAALRRHIDLTARLRHYSGQLREMAFMAASVLFGVGMALEVSHEFAAMARAGNSSQSPIVEVTSGLVPIIQWFAVAMCALLVACIALGVLSILKFSDMYVREDRLLERELAGGAAHLQQHCAPDIMRDAVLASRRKVVTWFWYLLAAIVYAGVIILVGHVAHEGFRSITEVGARVAAGVSLGVAMVLFLRWLLFMRQLKRLVTAGELIEDLLAAYAGTWKSALREAPGAAGSLVK